MCSINNLTFVQCGGDLIERKFLSDIDVELLKLRTGAKRIDKLCNSHKLNFVDLYSKKFSKCCDPFQYLGNQRHSKPNKTVSEIDYKFFKEGHPCFKLIPGQKICKSCKAAVLNYNGDGNNPSTSSVVTAESTSAAPNPEAGTSGVGVELSKTVPECEDSTKTAEETTLSQAGETENIPSSGELFTTPVEVTVEKLNSGVKIIAPDVSPFDLKKLKQQKTYGAQKVERIMENVEKKVAAVTSNFQQTTSSKEDLIKIKEDFEYLYNSLKEKMKVTTKRSEKVQILTMIVNLPNQSTAKIMEDFKVSNFMVRTAKKLCDEKGVFSSPDAKRGRSLDPEIEKKVIEFYLDPINSRILPGKKDFKSVKIDGKREHRQKRLILLNLKDLHQAYLLKYKETPDFYVSFSKFAELRPQECILAGASGTHAVCVCETHENFKLMVNSAAIPNPDNEDGNHKILTYKDILNRAVCENPTDACYLQSPGSQCKNCPKFQAVRDLLDNTFDSRLQDDVSFKQWKSTDGYRLERITMEVDEFIDFFMEILPAMLKHSYIAKQQGLFFQKKRDDLKPGEVLVIGDFAENYSFIIQDAVYGVHWNNRQSTIHPFVCYYKEEGELKSLNFVIISDCMDHDNHSFHTFQFKLIQFLKSKITPLSHIIYLTDGAPSQYKNRFGVRNLHRHKKDFDLTAEHHFFCTAHGKNPCDGLGGTIKRLAARESLQRTAEKEQLDSPKKLFDWAVEKFKDSITFSYVYKEEVLATSAKFKARIDSAPEVTGIRSFHSVLPVSENVIKFRYYSFSNQDMYRYFGEPGKHTASDLWGHVTVKIDSAWYLAQVMNHSNDGIVVKKLSPKGPARYFQLSEEILTIPFSDFISVVNPLTKDMIRFSLKRDDSSYAKQQLQIRLPPPAANTSKRARK